jgi:hypothetical protein
MQLTEGFDQIAQCPPVLIQLALQKTNSVQQILNELLTLPKTVETVEKVVEKPVIQVVEKIVEVEKPVIQYVEKPVIKKVYRTKYVRNPLESFLIGAGCFLLGLLIGALLL